jgi:hypothetical protein
MNADPKLQLEKLGVRIEYLRSKHDKKDVTYDLRHERQPLTHVFDDWNEDIRRRDREAGRLHAPQQVALVAILIGFLLLLNWLWPLPK